MKVSYQWLQTYFAKPLPAPEKIRDLFIFGAFEVESLEEKRNDWIFDVKVSPNRASDCFSHRGIAREVSLLAGIPMRTDKPKKFPEQKTALTVSIEDKILCRRYIGKIIREVNIESSPEWLRARIESIGERSINNIVDAANLIMFDVGQPLHAFDADKIIGGISVRLAREGETIVTLDGKEVKLLPAHLLIADDGGPLAIAGVKGGKRAEVTEKTKNIILESANFNPISVRKTARGLNLLTEAARRFENDYSPELAEEAMAAFVWQIAKMAGGNITVETSVDIYPRRANPVVAGVSVEEANELLGTNLKEKDLKKILDRFGLSYSIVKDPVTRVAELARVYEGTLYKYGASITYDAPRFFDCSGLLAYCYRQMGVMTPRTSIDQFVFGAPIEKSELRPGDAVFSRNHELHETDTFTRENDGATVSQPVVHIKTKEFLSGTIVKSGVDHVGIYLGDGNVIHASGPSHKNSVAIENMATSKRFANIVGYRRMYSGGPRFVVLVPEERRDLKSSQDLVEEIGRVYGYRNVSSRPLPKGKRSGGAPKVFLYANKIRNTLVQYGWNEVMTSSFSRYGKVEVARPLAEDKRYARASLRDGLTEALNVNAYHAPLLGLFAIKMFEIGTVFPAADAEHVSLGLAVWAPGKDKKSNDARAAIFAEAQQALKEIGIKINSENQSDADVGLITMCNLTKLVNQLPEIRLNSKDFLWDKKNKIYQSLSPYPFVLRDIAVWTPKRTKPKSVLAIIKKHGGRFLIHQKPFDQFEKDGGTSYAFNLVFQSHDRTLTDDEINRVMKKVTDELNKKKGFQVR